VIIFLSIFFFLGNCFTYLLNIDFFKSTDLFYLIILSIFLLILLIIYFKKINNKIKSILYSFLFFLSGILFGIYNIDSLINYRLPNSIYSEKVNIFGQVNSIVNNDSKSFELDINYIESNKRKYNFNYRKKVLIKLGFDKSRKNKKIINKLKYGDILKLKVKLRKISNTKLYNYYLNKNIFATAYLIEIIKYSNSNNFKNIIYNRIIEYTDGLNNKYLIHGLILGDKSNIAKDEKLLFQNTGVSHLLAISGMHLGAVFVFGNYIFSFIWKTFYKKIYSAFGISRKKFASFGGLISIIFYGFISGFAIPTIRAFIFFVINSFSIFFPIRFKRTDIIGLTLFFIVLINPFCYLDLGFWLSFSIVTMLLYLNNIEINMTNNFLKIFGLPLKLFIFSTPITLLFFQKAPLVSPIVNILAIPYINLIVLPLLLLSLIFILNPALSKFFLNLSNILLDNFISFLKFFDWQYFLILPIDIYFFGLLSVFCLLIFMPNKIPGKLIGGLAIVLIFFNYFLKKPNYYTIKSTEKVNYISYFYS